MSANLLSRIALIALAISPINLHASSPTAQRVGHDDFHSIFEPLTASHTHSVMPRHFSPLQENIRTYLSTSSAPKIGSNTPFKVPGANINIIGSVVYSDNLPKGFYSISLDASNPLEEIYTAANKVPDNNFGAVAIDGIYYVAWQYDFYGMMLINYVDSYDMTTWEKISHSQLSSTAMFASDVSLDPVSGNVFGCYINDEADGYVFGIADYKNLSRTAIAPLTTAWNGVAFDSDGTLYVIDMNGDLLTVDKGTGSTSKIGCTGVIPMY